VGSPMQRMTPLEPSGDDHSPTYPLRQIVECQAPRSILTSIGLSCCDDPATHPAAEARRTDEAIPSQ
jgi:hypothetical protein